MAQGFEHSASNWYGQAVKHRQSWVDRLDPRLRVLSVSLFALAVVLSSRFAALTTGLLLAMLVTGQARLPLKRTLKRLLAVDLFMIFLLILLPFTTPPSSPDDLLFTLFGLPASGSGLLHALAITLKANAVVLMMLALIGTMNATTLGHALAQLHLPNKLVHLLLFMVRYLDVIGSEYKRMRRAMTARGFVMGVNRHTWRSVGYLVGMLLVHSLERAERIMAAMKCRGFTGQFYLHGEMRLSAQDHRFALVAGLCLLLLVGLNFL